MKGVSGPWASPPSRRRGHHWRHHGRRRPPPGIAGHRDWLLVTLGFVGGFRRSELAGITVADVEQVAEGLLVHLEQSKTDQEGKGRRVEIVYGTNASTCPVRSWRAWLAASAIRSGRVF